VLGSIAHELRWKNMVNSHTPSVSRTAAAGPKRPYETPLVLLLYVLLTIAMTYPAAFFLRTKVMGGPADNFHFLWELWYIAHALFDLHKSPFFDPDVYVPFGFSLIRNQDLSPGTVLLFSPLTHFFGDVFTYNFLILASFALTAFGTYLLARELWSNRLAAVLAGIIVGFCPYRFAHAGGHLSIVSTQWIPFFFLYLERLISKPRLKSAVLTGVFFGLSAWTTWYYFFMVPIAAVFYVAFRVDWKLPRKELWYLSKLGLASVGVALIFVLPFLIPYYLATHGGVVDYRGAGESQALAASVADYVIPPITHFWWGQKATQVWRHGANGTWQSEWQLYLGIVALLLAAAGLCHSRRRIVVALVAMALGCLLFSFGPGIYFIHPPPLGPGSNDVALSAIPAPGRWLRQLPGFNNLRAWARLGFFVEMAAGLLAAGGLARLLNGIKGRPRARITAQIAVAAGVILLALLDFFPGRAGMTPVTPRAVDRWLSAQPGNFAFMEYPISGHGYGGPAIYRTRLTGKRIIMGSSQNPPNLAFWQDLSAFPSPWTLDLLSRWGAKYVLVDENLYRAGVSFWLIYQTWDTLRSAIEASPRLNEVTVLSGVHVYEIVRGQKDGGGQLSNGSFEQRNQVPPGCDPGLFVTPNPVSIPAEQSGRAAISWNACGNSEARLTSTLNGGAEQAFATGQSGLVFLDNIKPGMHYEFRLYSSQQSNAVTTASLSTTERTTAIAADPNPLPPGPGGGRTKISWAILAGGDAEVYVSHNGGPEKLFARGASGTVEVNWIVTGSSYDFRLYSTDAPRRLLANTVVTR
jgi:hypothetical protein